MRCYAFAFSSVFDIEKLKSYLKNTNYNIVDFEELSHIKLPIINSNKEEGDVFIFNFGAFVCYGLDELTEIKLKKDLLKLTKTVPQAYDDDLYHFEYGSEALVGDDHITLPNRGVLNKLACAHALVQSVKLGAFENTITHLIERTKDIPTQLANKGKISLSRKATRKLMGRIFVERSSINLHLELLDCPNFFWENADLEPIYNMMTVELNIENRVAILNQRLGVLQELLDMLTTELANQHSSFLEWIIIILIAIEIVLMLGKEIIEIF